MEDEFLSPLAQRSYPARREVQPEDDSPVRTPFQRDRDRIVHCKAFRRLKHKTQVYIAPEGDHYRTRLTHTIETTGIARTVSRALGLNEDLTEAIGLGHDLGPRAVRPHRRGGARRLPATSATGCASSHNVHSLRVVERLERDGQGLNLTEQVRDGILRHTGDELPATLEGRIVRLVDRIAYINHDIDDALRAGIAAARRSSRAPRSSCWATRARSASTRSCATSCERSSEAGDIVQVRGRGRRDGPPAHVHVRARVPGARPRSASTRASSGCCARCSTIWWRTHPRRPRPTPPTPTA